MRFPDSWYVNQIDQVLVNLRLSNSVLDVRTFSNADCGSNNFLVAGRFKVKLKKMEKKRDKQIEFFDIQKLDDLGSVKIFVKT